MCYRKTQRTILAAKQHINGVVRLLFLFFPLPKWDTTGVRTIVVPDIRQTVFIWSTKPTGTNHPPLARQLYAVVYSLINYGPGG